MNLLKIFFIIIVFIIQGYFIINAQNNQIGTENNLIIDGSIVDEPREFNYFECIQEKFEFVGNTQALVGKTIDIKIKATGSLQYSIPDNIVFYLYDDLGELKEVYTGSDYSHTFLGIGKFNLKADIKEPNGCHYLISTPIKVYKGIIFYIGSEREDFSYGFGSKFENENTLFKKVDISKKGILTKDDVMKKLTENLFFLINAESIIIDTNEIGAVLEVIGDLVSFHNTLDLTNKNLFVVSDVNNSFLKRILARYLRLININEIFVIEKEMFLNFLSKIGYGINIYEIPYVKIFNLSFQSTPKYFIVSYLVDYLIYNGFPSSLIILLISLSVSALIISIFRQVVGFSVFGATSPLLFAISMTIIGIKLSLILMFVAFLATYLTRIFTNKIYLLYSPKIVMLIILYIIISILFFAIDKLLNLNLIDFSIFSNSLIVFPILMLIVIANKVFYEGFSLFSIGWWTSFFEFLIVSFCIYFLMIWISFQHFILTFPEIIIVVLLLNIIVGRFSGLQLLEYIRFFPLIKKYLDEE